MPKETMRWLLTSELESLRDNYARIASEPDQAEIPGGACVSMAAKLAAAEEVVQLHREIKFRQSFVY